MCGNIQDIILVNDLFGAVAYFGRAIYWLYIGSGFKSHQLHRREPIWLGVKNPWMAHLYFYRLCTAPETWAPLLAIAQRSCSIMVVHNLGTIENQVRFLARALMVVMLNGDATGLHPVTKQVRFLLRLPIALIPNGQVLERHSS